MRTFDDKDGAEWEVVVGRESWGTVVAIFVPRKGGAPPRQTVLDTVSADDAPRWLRERSTEELQGLLDRTEPKAME